MRPFEEVATLALTVAFAGEMAAGELAEGWQGSLLGVTSRGVFVQGRAGRVLFLTPEAPGGPLTLNLAGDARPLRAMKPGMAAICRSGSLAVPEANVRIEAGGAPIWRAPAPTAEALGPDERRARLGQLLRALQRERGRGHFALLEAALEPADRGGESRPPLPGEGSLPRPSGRPAPRRQGDNRARAAGERARIEALRQAMEAGAPAGISAALAEFLGRGRGLTPAGDDLAAGLLLALNRWGAALHPGLDVSALNRNISLWARRRTTALAASLIECAAAGQADERLVRALDGLVSGNLPVAACCACLLDWGSTSGGDALAGMALALPGG